MNLRARAPHWAWIAAFLPFVLLAAWRVPEGPRVDEEDYAHYLLHAKALAEGRPYTDIGFIPTSLSPYGGPIARPPGLPVLLAPVVAAGGVNSPLIPLLSIALGLAFLVVAARALVVREQVLLALTVGLVSGLQPSVLHFAPEPLTDLPFGALVWGVILLCETDLPWSRGRVLALALTGAAAISLRIAGVALIPAMAAYGLLHFRTQRLRPLIPLLIWSATFWAITTLLPTADMPFTHETHGQPALTALWLGTVRAYGFGVLDAQLYPFPSDRLNLAYHLAALALLCVGAWVSLRTYWRSFVGIFTGGYIAMLFVIPVRDLRYLYPLIPVVVLLTAKGLLFCLGKLLPRHPESRRLAIVAAAAATVALFATASQWQAATPSGLAAHPDARALFDAMRPLARAPEARVLSFKPRIITLETGVAAMPIFGAAPDSVVRELCARAISHMVVGDLGIFPRETEQLRAATAAFPAAFREVYGNASFTLWRFDAERQRATDPGSCPTTRPLSSELSLSQDAGPSGP